LTVDLSSYPRWNDSCIWRIKDELLLVFLIHEIKDAEIRHDVHNIVLNTEGKDTWLLCTGEHTIHDIVDILHKKYEGDYLVIQHDVIDMVVNLVEKGYIVVGDSPHVVTRDLDENAYLVRSDDVITNTVEDKFVIMHMKTDEIHSFDQDMEQVWDLCDGSHTVGEIVSAVDTDGVFMIHFLIRLGAVTLK
jgi:hypothetical protein